MYHEVVTCVTFIWRILGMIEHIFADKILNTEVFRIFEEVLNRLQKRKGNICRSNRFTGNIYFLSFIIAEKGFNLLCFATFLHFLECFPWKQEREIINIQISQKPLTNTLLYLYTLPSDQFFDLKFFINSSNHTP